MFEKFQQLTPLQRSLIVLVPVAILIALAVLLVHNSDQASQAANTPSVSSSPSATLPDPSVSPSTSVSPYALNTPPVGSQSGKDTPDNTKKYTAAQKTAAATAAFKAMTAYCRYLPNETAQQHLDRLRPYYVPADFDLATGDVIGVIKTQQCEAYTNAELTALESDGALTFGLAMQQATIYNAGSPIVGQTADSGKDIAYSKAITMRATMQLVKGKWLAEHITSSNGE